MSPTPLFPAWYRCPQCGRREWVYTARNLGALERRGHHDWRAPYPLCLGQLEAEPEPCPLCRRGFCPEHGVEVAK